MSHSIVFLGATGAVGWEVLEVLKDHIQVSKITLLGRRKIVDLHNHCTQYMIDIFEPWTYTATLWNHDTAICTLGVGQPSKVSKEEFLKIDKTAVLNFAIGCKDAWVKHFLLLSSVWSDSSSRSFFLRAKWELIDEITALGFEQFSVFQPSMIITPINRYWISQAITLAVRPFIDRLFLWSWKKYRGIAVEELWKAIARQVFVIKKWIYVLTREDFSS